jgi:hypothetical protein
MKKAWQKPVLIVLVRSRPEEAILNGCKGQQSGAPENGDDYCLSVDVCVECTGWSAS